MWLVRLASRCEAIVNGLVAAGDEYGLRGFHVDDNPVFTLSFCFSLGLYASLALLM